MAAHRRASWRRTQARSHAPAVTVEYKAVIGANDVIVLKTSVGQRQHAMPALIVESDGPTVAPAKDDEATAARIACKEVAPHLPALGDGKPGRTGIQNVSSSISRPPLSATIWRIRSSE
jgi:hypothetical protein